MPWWLDPLAALAALVGGVLALLIYIIAAGLVLGAIIYLAMKVYKWLEEHL
jgi:xanthine/uracil/vitamin C permease (AzgA family)